LIASEVWIKSKTAERYIKEDDSTTDRAMGVGHLRIIRGIYSNRSNNTEKRERLIISALYLTFT